MAIAGVHSRSPLPVFSFGKRREWLGEEGGGGAAGASASGSRVASFSVYRISFRLYINNFSDNMYAFLSVNYRYSLISFTT